ncbi:MAG: PRC-barrel domain-containing protein [Ilumatobacteraceae bacterium]
MHRSATELADWVDRRAVDQHGEPVGVVVDIYLDMGTRRAKWLAISSGFFGTRTVVAPVRGASLLGGDVVISHPRELIGATPPVEAVVTIPLAVEQSVIDHYARGCVTPAGPPAERQRQP